MRVSDLILFYLTAQSITASHVVMQQCWCGACWIQWGSFTLWGLHREGTFVPLPLVRPADVSLLTWKGGSGSGMRLGFGGCCCHWTNSIPMLHLLSSLLHYQPISLSTPIWLPSTHYPQALYEALPGATGIHGWSLCRLSYLPFWAVANALCGWECNPNQLSGTGIAESSTFPTSIIIHVSTVSMFHLLLISIPKSVSTC